MGDALAATGEIGIIPHLLDKLSDTNIFWNTSWNGKQITSAQCDVPLMVLLKLTGQAPADYQVTITSGSPRMVGFKDDKARQAAIKKFNEWWAQAKLLPRYKDITPIDLPSLHPTGRDDGDDSGYDRFLQ
jgi:hypothetical protein